MRRNPCSSILPGVREVGRQAGIGLLKFEASYRAREAGISSLKFQGFPHVHAGARWELD